jgi:hypothetical protein
MRNQLSILNTLLSPEHEIALDKSYESIEKDMENVVVHVKHRKPKGGFLCEEEKMKNREMEKILPKLESVFATPKNCFKVFREKFRMSRYKNHISAATPHTPPAANGAKHTKLRHKFYLHLKWM